ncbi:disco-interacting protein 2-like [Aphis craccivora]|uniref:Disco-interacting protein 2-like n=1 Tax=Aphis craccivora TaxID=307492 RepID=A0A6G0ZLN9_APHCR|nr:disco-interacting protein 2-like [Aphis craccivora]
MAEFNVDVMRLPDEIREKLAELELELSEGKYLLTVFSFVSLPFAGSLSEGSTAGVVISPAPGLCQPLN